MGTMVETDMDQFIRSHKQKVQHERKELDDRVSYPAGPPVASPSTRKQWDRGRALESKPAEEPRAPPQSNDTGLVLGNDTVHDQKKRQLQRERQQEYNELLNKKGPGLRRRPRTPAHEGLPLGQYSEKRKALDKERNEEMKAALTKPDMSLNKDKGDVFDYEATKKSHLEEKRRDYNQYLNEMKNKRGRHIATPEHGMFVGEDQTKRDKLIRERNMKYKQALEKQWMDQLSHKALLEGEVAHATPRSISDSPRKVHYSHVNADIPVPRLKLNEDTKHLVEERVVDMPKVTPRQIPQLQPEPVHDGLRTLQPHQYASKSREPFYPGDMGYHRGQEEVQGQAEGHVYDEFMMCLREQNRGRNIDRSPRKTIDRDHPNRRSRSYEQDASPRPFGAGLEKFQWQRPNLRTPISEVRRSRSLSPVRRNQQIDLEERKRQLQRLLEEYDQTVPEGRYYLESPPPPSYPTQGNQDQGQVHVYLDQSPRNVRQEIVQRMYDQQMAEKQQVLKQEYERERAEAQRLANEQGNTFEQQEYQNKHRQLEEDKKREYQEYLAEHPSPRINLRKKEVTPENLRQGLPLYQSKYDVKRQELQTARKQEYNDILQKHAEQPNRKWPSPNPEFFLESFGKVDPVKDRLLEERKKEYQEILKQQRKLRREMPEGTGATLPVGEYTDTRKQQLQTERQREYQELQQQKQATERRRGLPPKPPTPNHFFKNLGQHDRQIEALGEERKKEYNQKLSHENYRSRGRTAPGTNDGSSLQIGGTGSAEGPRGETYATLPGLHYSDSPEIRKMKVRNNEYNEFLREKKHKDAHRFDSKKPSSDRRHSEPNSPRGKAVAGTLPGLNYSDSAEKRKVKERNKEYNEYLNQKNRRKGWSTPTYEEILEQKRREEALRRQDEEPSRLRSFHSEGALNRLEDNLRARELDKEFDIRKVRFDDERKYANGILEDDNWLNPERREEQYHKLTEPPPPREEIREDMTAVRQPYNATLLVGGASGLGNNETQSAKRRREQDYGRQLQIQMEEQQAARKREKIKGLAVNASGLVDPEKSSFRVKELSGEQIISPRRQHKANDVQRYHTKFLVDDRDDYDAVGRRTADYRTTGFAPPQTTFGGPGVGLGSGLMLGGLGLGSPGKEANVSSNIGAAPARGILTNRDVPSPRLPASPRLSDIGDSLQLNLGGVGTDRGRRRDRDISGIDPGIVGLLEQRRHPGAINPPPGLMYQPSLPEISEVPSLNPLSGTYVTGGGGGLGGPYSSVDEAYHYFGLQNPLDVPDVGGGVPALNLGGDYGRRGSPTRVTFREPSPVTFSEKPGDDRAHRKRDRSKERISPYQFPSDDDGRSRSRQETLSYGAELERQIAEKRMQKQREREEQDRYERKLEEDIRNYNPFGRSGGGAPIKDPGGNPIADLRSLQRGNLSDRQSPVRQQIPPGSLSPQPPAPRDDLIEPPPPQYNALGESSYARGGHGIFGQPKTEAEKDITDKYKDELRQQIADKRRREQMEKERERMEEEKENKRLEDQRQRMQSEYEEEQKKVRAREEEARRKNEELRKQAEEKKKESERKKREAEDSRMREQQDQIERERQERQQRQAEENRIKSPPVPAIKSKNDQQRTNSPPLPAHRRERESPRPASKASRISSRAQRSPAPGPVKRENSSDVLTQLASMRKQLQNERKRVEDALENSKNEPDVFDPRMIQRPGPSNKLVFENAMNKNASLPPQRAQTSDMANARNIQQFNELKNNSHTPAHRAFRSMFPEAPITNTTLEAQQDAMLRQQEETLRGMRDKNPFENSTSLGTGRHGNSSARSQLAANSAFIDIDGVNHFPDDFEDMAGTRNDSARARRRDRFSPRGPSVNGMGSQTSLNVERIQIKNEERLRKLQQMTTGDDTSIGDPDDILDRFMAKQRYQRPPSGRTLDDDTWLRAGSQAL